MNKCGYCGKALSGSFQFCCNECETNYKKSIEKDKRKIKYFIIGIIVGFLLMLYGALANSDFIIGDGIILMGIILVILPFTTPETIAFLGYRKSKFAGRITGILLIIVGIWISFI